MDNQEWPPQQDLGELHFNTGRSFLPPRPLNDGTCLEHVEFTFECIENTMQELDLITTQQAWMSEKKPVDKPTQTRKYNAGSTKQIINCTQEKMPTSA